MSHIKTGPIPYASIESKCNSMLCFAQYGGDDMQKEKKNTYAPAPFAKDFSICPHK